MGSRTTETAAAPTTEEAVTADPAIQRAGDPLSPQGILALQRSIGNAAVAALVARRIHGEDVAERPAATGADAWTETEIKAIQRELKRLGLYSYTIDGDRGPKTNAGLTAAFDSEAWKSTGATEVHEKLKAAKKPDDPGGTRLNYGELFKDGVLDVTFGVGYFEGNPPAEETRQVAKAVMDELVTRGYKEDNDTAADILDKAGRPLSQKTTGRFFVKQNAFSYGPPAGESRSIHAIVRVVFNDVAGGGAAASAAFQEGMAVGDAVWYSGHGRYGTARTSTATTSSSASTTRTASCSRRSTTTSRSRRFSARAARTRGRSFRTGSRTTRSRSTCPTPATCAWSATPATASSAPTSSTGRSRSRTPRSSPARRASSARRRRRARRSTA